MYNELEFDYDDEEYGEYDVYDLEALGYWGSEDPDEVSIYDRIFDKEAYMARRADLIYEDYKLGLCDKKGNYH